MRGSGKTTVGKSLSIKLCRPLIEVDSLIEVKIGGRIADFVAKNGWKKFRDCESEIISRISNKKNSVISCGGGVVERTENIKNLKRNGFLIYLSANVDTLYKRIGENKVRPLLTNAKSMKIDLENTFRKRKDLYKKAADLSISTDNKTVEEICRDIIRALNKLYD